MEIYIFQQIIIDKGMIVRDMNNSVQRAFLFNKEYHHVTKITFLFKMIEIIVMKHVLDISHHYIHSYLDKLEKYYKDKVEFDAYPMRLQAWTVANELWQKKIRN